MGIYWEYQRKIIRGKWLSRFLSEEPRLSWASASNIQQEFARLTQPRKSLRLLGPMGDQFFLTNKRQVFFLFVRQVLGVATMVFFLQQHDDLTKHPSDGLLFRIVRILKGKALQLQVCV